MVANLFIAALSVLCAAALVDEEMPLAYAFGLAAILLYWGRALRAQLRATERWNSMRPPPADASEAETVAEIEGEPSRTRSIRNQTRERSGKDAA